MSKINEKFKQNIASIPTIKRLPSYLNLVKRASSDGIQIISATNIAKELDLEPIQVRKDLAVTGIIGKPRIGYNVEELALALQSFLNWNVKHKAIVVGCGNLGSALMNYGELKNHGLTIVGAADASPEKIGTEKMGVKISAVGDLPGLIKRTGATMVILTVPPAQAQNVAGILDGTDINAIWNFTNVKLKIADRILVLMEDLSSGFAVISFHLPFYKET
ncbi:MULTISPECIES: redox-sensing transcriptional repressor Rex [unclassified Oceanispirochaeta]|uniref:redox-sensing transcriptional repressor Rex n=1 Tax=unclassified Oceanispirochaeta TaxID=2635722 RepID=UPI000E09C800|nr:MULTISPECIES: redox-sensing transcriptional repressor Rex [unclassified Oceanispirochaeta]MBF9018657.1 redox-sensing transcriptional repressor Rex [Oceanispirochaeta sp. M2]NPD75094.1 redox-sensing transcriptional repressor Rex [Oceanispirochaeta sp. M1]RDG29051.1 redox-sensing transcriptional repressor Rex [Oceanispirochaeta sp. M1]